MPGIELVLGGTAAVYCVHDRQKRQIRNPDDCMRLIRDTNARLLAFGAKFQTCGCCENVFPCVTDIPQLCPGCQGHNFHKLGGPLNDPIEGVL